MDRFASYTESYYSSPRGQYCSDAAYVTNDKATFQLLVSNTLIVWSEIFPEQAVVQWIIRWTTNQGIARSIPRFSGFLDETLNRGQDFLGNMLSQGLLFKHFEKKRKRFNC